MVTKPSPSPETLRALCEACDKWYGRTDGDPPEGWHEQSKEHFFALKRYRAEIAQKLRSRAEVDAEIAQVVRSFQPLPSTQHGAVWEIRGVFPERLMKLCAEPTAPEPATEGPLGNHLTDHDADAREPEACSCEESEALKDQITELQRLLSHAYRTAAELAKTLETTP